MTSTPDDAMSALAEDVVAQIDEAAAAGELATAIEHIQAANEALARYREHWPHADETILPLTQDLDDISDVLDEMYGEHVGVGLGYEVAREDGNGNGE